MKYTVEIPQLKALQDAFRKAPELVTNEVMKAGNRSLVRYQATARQKAPIRNGQLRGSIQIRPMSRVGNRIEGSVGTGLNYACIFGASTRIVTKDGYKTIGKIEVGDLVLTQAGDYQPVIAKHAFPALEKPDLIDIEVEWKRDGTHKITVTADHKILVFRDGRNKWVPAGELVASDLLYQRKKIPVNKGTARTKTCVGCGGVFTGRNKVHCSNQCKWIHWNSGANPHFGMKRSPDTVKKISEMNRARLRLKPHTHPNRILAQRGHETSYESAIKQWLDGRGVEYVQQHSINGRFVDFFLPDTNTVIEADGAFWHQDQSKDVERDVQILAGADDLTIIHLHFYERRFSPNLNLNPLPRAYYVPCNPGPNSYTDPEQFETTRIMSLRPWRYGVTKKHRNDPQAAKLYDLTVANVHSFFANGILVSNSHQEQGTGIYGSNHAPIRPRRARVLAFQVGGKTVFAKSVKGTKGKWYMRGSLQQNQAATMRDFDKACENVTKALGGVR